MPAKQTATVMKIGTNLQWGIATLQKQEDRFLKMKFS